MQVGAQDVAAGLKFSAACTLRCTEYDAGVPEALCSTSSDGKDGLFPLPRGAPLAPGLSPRDITFTSVEGDFEVFRGVWRMQPASALGTAVVENSNGNISNAGEHTLLCYSLFVQPQKWLPVGLIQSRIRAEILKNLDAVRRESERVHALQAR